jgi:hypothetical protein
MHDGVAALVGAGAGDPEGLAMILAKPRRVGLHDEFLEQLGEFRALFVGSGAPVAAEGELGERGHVEMSVQQPAEAGLAFGPGHARIAQFADGLTAERLHEGRCCRIAIVGACRSRGERESDAQQDGTNHAHGGHGSGVACSGRVALHNEQRQSIR